MNRGFVKPLFSSKYAVSIEWKNSLCLKLFPFKEGPQDSLCVAETSDKIRKSMLDIFKVNHQKKPHQNYPKPEI